MQRIWAWNRWYDQQPEPRRTLLFFGMACALLFWPIPAQFLILAIGDPDLNRLSLSLTMIAALMFAVVGLLRSAYLRNPNR